jgi:hypothetical protein
MTWNEVPLSETVRCWPVPRSALPANKAISNQNQSAVANYVPTTIQSVMTYCAPVLVIVSVPSPAELVRKLAN